MVSCGVGRRCSSDPALLWLWCRPAAVAPIQPLAWEFPCAVGGALKRQKKKKKKKESNSGGSSRGGLDPWPSQWVKASGIATASAQVTAAAWIPGQATSICCRYPLKK